MKILVFTVTSWNSVVGANTWASLLEQYKGNEDIEIQNICIRDEIPDNDICSKYFQISESKIIKSLFNRKIKTGQEISTQKSPAASDTLQEHNERYEKMTKHRRYSMLLMRELIWKLGKWNTKELRDFIDDFQPDIILHGMEGYVHLNRIIEFAAKRTGAKAIGYIMDDNFTYKQSSEIGYKILRFFQKNSLKRLICLTSEFFAISPMTKREADNVLGIDCKVLTKPLNDIPERRAFKENPPYKMLYTGNLLIGRDESLLKLAKALKEINKDTVNFTVDVYTPTQINPEYIPLLKESGVNVYEPIPQSEVLSKQKDADILLFLEDTDGKDAKTARLSFSTKITDYLSTGNIIFTVGNKDTSPMDYLSSENAAFTAQTDEEILNNLNKILNNTSSVNEITENARKIAIENHNPEKINGLFDSVLKRVYNS